MSVTVITDAAASLPDEVAAAHDVVVVPMQITVGGRTVASDAIDSAEILNHLEDGLSTAGPSPGDFAAAIEAAPGDEAVIVTIASTMSSTHGAAVVAARLASKPVTVVDTGTAAGAEGLVVLAAARAAARGLDRDSVARVAGEVGGRVRLVASVAGLDYLVRSGRVPQIAGWAGRLLGLRPLFEFRDGRAHALRPAASADAAVERILDMWRKSAEPAAELHVAAMHAFDLDGAHRLLDAVTAEVRPASSFVGEFGPVMVAHTGPGLVGLAWYWEPPDGAEGVKPDPAQR